MAGVKKRINVDGLCASERRILDRWDAGATVDEIYRELGLKRGYVRRVLATFSGNDEERRNAEAMRRGSEALLAALQAA